MVERPNLTLLLETWAYRLELEGARAAGVHVRAEDGTETLVRARREVLLCAGAVDSPRLLLHSGIGPARDLEELGIPVAHDLPGVGENLLDHPESVIVTLVDGIRIARRIARTEPLAGWLKREVCPGPEITDDEELSAYARQVAHTVYHPEGTCRMGGTDDQLAVVDPELRVRGLDGLRIADASVFPTPGQWILRNGSYGCRSAPTAAGPRQCLSATLGKMLSAIREPTGLSTDERRAFPRMSRRAFPRMNDGPFHGWTTGLSTDRVAS